MPSPNENAYAAGLFDGEGHVGFDFNRLSACGLNVDNTDPGLVRWLQDVYGGSVYRLPRPGVRVLQWRWQTTGVEAMAFARAVLPYTVSKTNQLLLWIELRNRMGKVTKQGLSADERAARGAILAHIKDEPYRSFSRNTKEADA